MNKWAVFDLDGTLIKGSSLEKSFFQFLIKQGGIPWFNIIKYMIKWVIASAKRNWDFYKTNKSYFKNISKKYLEEKVENYFEEEGVNKILSQGLEYVDKYRKENYKIMLLSGTPKFIAEKLTDYFKIDHLIASSMEELSGVLTGKVIGLHPFGERKTTLMKQAVSELEINLKESIVFANHYTDADHMKLFGQAVAVNPDEKLKEIALVNNWEVLNWYK